MTLRDEIIRRRVLLLFHSGSGLGGSYRLMLPVLEYLAGRVKETGLLIDAALPAGPAVEELRPFVGKIHLLHDGAFPINVRFRRVVAAVRAGWKNIERLGERLAEEPPDLVVSTTGAIRYGNVLARNLGATALQFVQESFAPPPYRRWLDETAPPDAFAGPSPALLSLPARHRPFFRLPYPRFGPPGGRDEALRKEYGLEKDEYVLGMVGAVNAHKGVHHLAAVLPGLPTETDDGRSVRVAFIGPRVDPETEERMRKMLDGTSWAERILFTGSLPTVRERTGLIDLILVLSCSEGLPLTLLEALDAGIPAVAFSVGLVKEVIEEGVNGVLLPAGSRAALRKTLTHLLKNERRREELERGARAKRVRREIWDDSEAVARRYEELFAEFAEQATPLRKRRGGTKCETRREDEARPEEGERGGEASRGEDISREKEREVSPNQPRSILILQSARREVMKRVWDALRREWPQASFTLVCHRNYPPPEEARLEKTIFYPNLENYRVEVLEKLVQERFDLAVLPVNDPADASYLRLRNFLERHSRRTECRDGTGERIALLTAKEFLRVFRDALFPPWMNPKSQ
ncbi:MAG: glycosyltransferase [Candidatus Hydrogenedentota bacterium]|nr:MAG: glycosyltransferase [Candidatus Hydrogenedentota bacterium]